MTVVANMPASVHLRLYRGDTFTRQFTFSIKDTGEPVPLTGTWEAQVRDAAEGEILASFTVDMTDAATGSLLLTLDGADVNALPDFGVWDLQQTDTALRTWCRGSVYVYTDVTRPAP